MKNALPVLTLATGLLFAVIAVAANKVVVVPLGGAIGNATSADVVKGKTFSSRVAGKGVKGTLELQQHYDIGDTGPAGGKVFFVTDYSHHGLEAALQDQGINVEWGCTGTPINGAGGVLIGTGVQNTSDILAGCTQANIAAELADNYEFNGYTDWFLPSKDELNILFFQKDVVGGFASASYWSSSQSSSDDAWYQDFSNGGQYSNYKDYPARVRAIRAF